MSTIYRSKESLMAWASELYKNEELEPENQQTLLERSYIYQEFFMDFTKRVKKVGVSGEIFNQPMNIDPSSKYDLNGVEMSYFLGGCITPDFVYVDAMIRMGADVHEVFQDRDSALSLSCVFINGDHPGYYRIIKRLLEVGVDPNLYHPLHHACRAGNLKACKLLLQYGADPKIKWKNKLPEAALSPSKRASFRKLPRGNRVEPQCWCLSGEPLAECHESSDGKEVDPLERCPCNSGKKYGRCCQKRGLKYSETRTNIIINRTIPCSGETGEKFTKLLHHFGKDKKPGDSLFPPDFAARFGQMRNSLANMLSQIKGFDPAFCYVMRQVEFFPRNWLKCLPKTEQKMRQTEWNRAVDKYIATCNDPRSKREIEIQAKIGLDGSALYKRCGGCGDIENEELEFKCCAKCKIVVYCSRECQVDHWKVVHKHDCKKLQVLQIDGDCPNHLGSQTVLMKFMGAELDMLAKS